jgi:putative tricarboxylic transport membrane protein
VGRAAILLPIGLSAFGCIILWQSLATMDYFLVARGAPGPGFLPFWLSLGVVILGVLLTVQAVRHPSAPAEDDAWPDAEGWQRIGMVLGGTAIAILLMEPLGFLLTSILFVGLLSYGLGFRKLKIIVPVAVGIGLFFDALFAVWLHVEMPPGILSF